MDKFFFSIFSSVIGLFYYPVFNACLIPPYRSHLGFKEIIIQILWKHTLFKGIKKITWKYNKAPTAKTTPIASPRANITTKSVVKVRITFGSSPVP